MGGILVILVIFDPLPTPRGVPKPRIFGILDLKCIIVISRYTCINVYSAKYTYTCIFSIILAVFARAPTSCAICGMFSTAESTPDQAGM